MPRVIYVKPYRMLLMERLVIGLLAIGFVVAVPVVIVWYLTGILYHLFWFLP
jgi:hypothetical protein